MKKYNNTLSSDPFIEGMLYGLVLGLKTCIMIFIFIWARASLIWEPQNWTTVLSFGARSRDCQLRARSAWKQRKAYLDKLDYTKGESQETKAQPTEQRWKCCGGLKYEKVSKSIQDNICNCWTRASSWMESTTPVVKCYVGVSKTPSLVKKLAAMRSYCSGRRWTGEDGLVTFQNVKST